MTTWDVTFRMRTVGSTPKAGDSAGWYPEPGSGGHIRGTVVRVELAMTAEDVIADTNKLLSEGKVLEAHNLVQKWLDQA